MPLVLGATEIFTPIIQGAAGAIGAGIVLGGFAVASAGIVNGWTRRRVEEDALRDGYIGAGFALLAWLFDQCIVYAASIWTN